MLTRAYCHDKEMHKLMRNPGFIMLYIPSSARESWLGKDWKEGDTEDLLDVQQRQQISILSTFRKFANAETHLRFPVIRVIEPCPLNTPLVYVRQEHE